MPIAHGGSAASLVAAYRNPQNGLCCASVIVEGDGFWASALRSSVTGIQMRGGVRIGIHGSISEMLEWLPAQHRKTTGVPLSKAQLRHVATEARQKSLEALGLDT